MRGRAAIDDEGSSEPEPHVSRAHKRRIVAVLVVTAVVGAIAWQARTWQPSRADEGTTTSSGTAGASGDDFRPLTLFPRGQRPKLPAVSGLTLQGTRLSLTDLAGHVLVLNVWASWCGPCRKEAPILARVADQAASRGVRFVGIDTRDTRANAQAFTRSFGIKYPSLVDTDGQLLLAFQGLIPLSGIPMTLVVDKFGAISARVVGPVDYPTLRGLVADTLTTGPSPRAPTTTP